MRSFMVNWKENKKFAVERKTLVDVIRPTGDIGLDAKAALNIFCSTYGNLKKNEVISLQEVNANGDSIGEPIAPTADENSIVPYKK